MQRREFLVVSFATTLGAAIAPRRLAATGAPIAMTVYKSASCGCCKLWVQYMQQNGFTIKVVDLDDLSEIKRTAGVPAAMQSCHTGLVGAYVVEGHVPADLVKEMLIEKPKILGLAVPGMVVGSPGMEQGSTKSPYDVVAFARSGQLRVYAKR